MGRSMLYLGKEYKLDFVGDDFDRVVFESKFLISRISIPLAAPRYHNYRRSDTQKSNRRSFVASLNRRRGYDRIFRFLGGAAY
jgi:hypothetical protein